MAERQRERLRDPEYRVKTYAAQREYKRKNHERALELNRERWLYHKGLVYSFYGDRCACCGETESAFLTVDHVNRDGAEHRKDKNAARDIYSWIVLNDFPDDFQLLCFNCNCGRERNGGVCPHQE
jgi:hypothetical protein